jgi:uncharacterized protein (TIGR03084 family)
MPEIAALCSDLVAEQVAVDGLLAGPPPADWSTPTPAPGWTIHHQVAHLCFFDGAALRAATAPKRFLATDRARSDADADAYHEQGLQEGLGQTPAALLERWQTQRGEFVAVVQVLDPARRIPWFGPSMGVASTVTARLMETWAHGQDIADALGRDRTPTARLRHIAHIGVRARPYAFHVRGLEPVEGEVHVQLTAPDGSLWTWGDEGVGDRVVGQALDFCLVVTRRRHLTDTTLEVEGPVARAWMAIAQSYAGEPGPGRQPGQFPRRGGRTVL